MRVSHGRGSSPLARGTVFYRQPVGRKRRFIPAGAGNSQRKSPGIHRLAVHPRWRGEQGSGSRLMIRFPGSSPLARGTGCATLPQRCSSRFIPAGAGNSEPFDLITGKRAVHPRWRGEQFEGGSMDAAQLGSSPLARGTDLRRGAGFRQSRFIPAGAGNSLRTVTMSGRLPVHPRWRGEQAAW